MMKSLIVMGCASRLPEQSHGNDSRQRCRDLIGREREAMPFRTSRIG
jgi:hypothetical protein